MATSRTRTDIHETLTNRLVEAVENSDGNATLPWLTGGTNLRPRNATTDKCYQGVIVLNLWVTSIERGYDGPCWCKRLPESAD